MFYVWTVRGCHADCHRHHTQHDHRHHCTAIEQVSRSDADGVSCGNGAGRRQSPHVHKVCVWMRRIASHDNSECLDDVDGIAREREIEKELKRAMCYV